MPFLVRDAKQDERFASNPLVTGSPHIRFYFGAPLVTKEEVALGSLCVIDTKPRDLGLKQIEALNAVARQVVTMLDIRKDVEALATLVEKYPAHKAGSEKHMDEVARLTNELQEILRRKQATKAS